VRILVYPHDLGIGGSQLNAIDIAHEIACRGHDVLVYGQPGPLTTHVAQLGLEFVESPDAGHRPTREIVRDLVRTIDDREIDIAHGYEWPPGLECYLACRGHSRARAVTTVMSMAVPPFLPHGMPLLVGTEQIAESERSGGRRLVSVLEPPVDIDANRPGVCADLSELRDRWGLLDDRPTVVCVTRLAHQLKLEGLLTAIGAIQALHVDRPAQLLIVGDGEARRDVEERAASANRALGYRAVVLTGELLDPRPAYEIADVCIAMGGSALRSMAFAKPLVVQGEGGFFRLLTPETLPDFLWAGWYGHGDGGHEPVSRLSRLLRGLLIDAEQRQELGRFGRTTIEQRFSLAAAASRQLEAYQSTLDLRRGGPRRVAEELAATAQFAGHHVDKRVKRALGHRAVDDFNARPVAKDGPSKPAVSGAGPIVYFAGVSWDAVAGTDRHLVRALAGQQNVVWVDPPMSWIARRRGGTAVPPLSSIGTGILRVSTSCPPGVSRPVLRRFAGWLTQRRALAAVQQTGLSASSIVVSSPDQLMPRWPGDTVRIYYETDDFVAGARLLGIGRRHARRCRAKNVRRSDIVLGITESLTHELAVGEALFATLPNGTDHRHFQGIDDIPPAADVRLDRPIVGVVGQLNERLEVGALEAVADLELNLLLLGPRHETSAQTAARLDALLERPNVQWIDQQPFDRLPSYLAAMDVGLTPYTSTAFNRSSFPLKTLEYLAAGLPVVSTDLPSARALDTDLLMLATTPAEFAKMTAYLLEQPADPELVERRREFAEAHGWDSRAAQLEAIIAAARARAS
jgi:glycosyltransferase involved in cell wall biosynthesis